MADNKKIVKYKKPKNINIGIIIFIIIFIYIIFNVFSYLTSEHVSVYEVQQGTIAENNTYTGLILRNETVYNSDYSGYVDYYLRDATKASYNTLVYSVDESGDIADKIKSASSDDIDLSQKSFSNIQDAMGAYVSSYNSNSFYSVYDFKEELEAQLMEIVNQNALDSISDYVTNAEGNNSFHQVTAIEPGIVTYYIDGFENVTTDSFTPDMLNVLNYKKNNLKQNTSISAGDAVYKLLTNEEWHIVIQVADSIYEKLAADKDGVVKIKFKKDNTTCWAYYSCKQIDSAYYIILDLRNNMIRFANDRYNEIELLMDEQSGLKIPNTAITSKDFFIVPKTYFLKGGDSNSLGILVSGSDGTTSFVNTTIYYATDDNYYIDEDEILAGSVIKKSDSNETYTISDMDSLDGVYNINKGYAIFKQIDILFQNKEYAIVRTGTDYGLSLYDHIALESNKVQENDLIN